ncbi:MAG TPA: NfeD family protein [Syntrophomonadaceae bacterium]|nr:NfeD family protein [Syntrophomonadaceae bacterium]HNX29835.1 NfeD family protein [Syntrophomonadaceae bacterium]HPR92928.1 NfeD family protein [Syntrophomonadaceae bacterium]
MSVIAWIVVALVCGAIEIFTVGFWFLYLSLSALVVALGVSLEWFPQIETQLLIFAFLTVLLVIFTRPLVLKLIKSNDTASNVKALIGQRGITVDEMLPLHYGQVKINGEIWTAVSSEEIEAGTLIEVLSIDGVKLVVQKAS